MLTESDMRERQHRVRQRLDERRDAVRRAGLFRPLRQHRRVHGGPVLQQQPGYKVRI